MNDEVDQNTVESNGEIVKKYLLIVNENLIAICLSNQLFSVNATPTVKIVLNKGKQIWKPKAIDIGYQWRPTGKKLTLGKLDGGSQWRPTGKKFALGGMCHLTKLFVKCRQDHALVSWTQAVHNICRGFCDSRVYSVEGLGHNLFSVGQFCDTDLEVAFRKHTCFVRDIHGTDILKGSRSTNLYTISMDEMMKSSPICLLSKASKSKSWLWHRRLNHLNSDA
ncbi:integrase, catalytic region, zinc finger, CCHC-type containing protein [Tanacetum coccineum]